MSAQPERILLVDLKNKSLLFITDINSIVILDYKTTPELGLVVDPDKQLTLLQS